jgi:Uma2 family endonuclease
MARMRAVLLEVREDELAHRRRRGLDRHDEMWEGVLHMAPAPTYEHQRMVDRLLLFLVPLLERTGRGVLVSGINVFNDKSKAEDYRIPDLTFVAAGREAILREEGVRGGAPDTVIEIRSPGDETYEKLPFFAVLGVREVIVIGRDSKAPEVYRLAGSQYLAVAADREGWIAAETLGVRFRLEAAAKPRLVIEADAPAEGRAEI